MKQFLQLAGAILVSVSIALMGWGTFLQDQGLGGKTDSACTVNSVVSAPVGGDISSSVLSAYSNRAWASIQLYSGNNGVATGTVSLSFDEGAASVLANGFELATNTPEIIFGLNTDFPYVGAVTGITSNGSTTVRVTECRY